MTTTLILRTSRPDGTSRNGFQWPTSGPVTCPDWDPAPTCGNGLHGLPWGEGDAHLLDWATDALWQVVEVPTADLVDLDGKVKFPAGAVVHTGDRLSATTYLAADPRSAGHIIHGATVTGGDRSTVTGGDESTLTSGHRSTLTGGHRSTVVFRWWDASVARGRLTVAYVGENGIEPGVAYRVDDRGAVVPAEVAP